MLRPQAEHSLDVQLFAKSCRCTKQARRPARFSPQAACSFGCCRPPCHAWLTRLLQVPAAQAEGRLMTNASLRARQVRGCVAATSALSGAADAHTQTSRPCSWLLMAASHRQAGAHALHAHAHRMPHAHGTVLGTGRRDPRIGVHELHTGGGRMPSSPPSPPPHPIPRCVK